MLFLKYFHWQPTGLKALVLSDILNLKESFAANIVIMKEEISDSDQNQILL